MKSIVRWNPINYFRLVFGHFFLWISLYLLPEKEWEKIIRIIWEEKDKHDGPNETLN